jgi:hypothetical protein
MKAFLIIILEPVFSSNKESIFSQLSSLIPNLIQQPGFMVVQGQQDRVQDGVDLGSFGGKVTLSENKLAFKNLGG